MASMREIIVGTFHGHILPITGVKAVRLLAAVEPVRT